MILVRCSLDRGLDRPQVIHEVVVITETRGTDVYHDDCKEHKHHSHPNRPRVISNVMPESTRASAGVVLATLITHWENVT